MSTPPLVMGEFAEVEESHRSTVLLNSQYSRSVLLKLHHPHPTLRFLRHLHTYILCLRLFLSLHLSSLGVLTY